MVVTRLLSTNKRREKSRLSLTRNGYTLKTMDLEFLLFARTSRILQTTECLTRRRRGFQRPIYPRLHGLDCSLVQTSRILTTRQRSVPMVLVQSVHQSSQRSSLESLTMEIRCARLLRRTILRLLRQLYQNPRSEVFV